jgi:hypothetical protein
MASANDANIAVKRPEKASYSVVLAFKSSCGIFKISALNTLAGEGSAKTGTALNEQSVCHKAKTTHMPAIG